MLSAGFSGTTVLAGAVRAVCTAAATGADVLKCDVLTEKPLTVHLDDKQRKEVQEQLKGLADADDLSDDAAKEKLDKLLGTRTEETLLDDLCKAMDSRWSLDVIRHGFKCYGEAIKIAYFAPAHGMNPEVAALYAKNRLTLLRFYP